MDKIMPEIWPDDLWKIACYTSIKIGDGHDAIKTLTPLGAFVCGCGVSTDRHNSDDEKTVANFLRDMADALENGGWGDYTEVRGWRWEKIAVRTGRKWEPPNYD